MILNYDMKQSGERIQQLRNKNGLTQERIAETLNVDRSFYSRIEAGKKGCSIDLFIRLSELFNVSLDYLILGRYCYSASDCNDKAQLKETIEELLSHLERLRKIL